MDPTWTGPLRRKPGVGKPPSHPDKPVNSGDAGDRERDFRLQQGSEFTGLQTGHKYVHSKHAWLRVTLLINPAFAVLLLLFYALSQAT
jgi:hypothetical protein